MARHVLEDNLHDHKQSAFQALCNVQLSSKVLSRNARHCLAAGVRMSPLLVSDRPEAQVTPHKLAVAEVQSSLAHSELQQRARPALARQGSLRSTQDGAWQARSLGSTPPEGCAHFLYDMGGESCQVHRRVILSAALSALQVAQHDVLPQRHMAGGVCVQHVL